MRREGEEKKEAKNLLVNLVFLEFGEPGYLLPCWLVACPQPFHCAPAGDAFVLLSVHMQLATCTLVVSTINSICQVESVQINFIAFHSSTCKYGIACTVASSHAHRVSKSAEKSPLSDTGEIIIVLASSIIIIIIISRAQFD